MNRLRWFGHLARKESEAMRAPREDLVLEVVRNDIKELGLVRVDALDRYAWKMKIVGANHFVHMIVNQVYLLVKLQMESNFVA